MAAVKWDAISRYVELVHEAAGLIQRGDVMDIALAEGADDDVVDAVDAIGSRVFRNPAEVRDFLVKQGYVVG